MCRDKKHFSKHENRRIMNVYVNVVLNVILKRLVKGSLRTIRTTTKGIHDWLGRCRLFGRGGGVLLALLHSRLL